MSSLTLATKTYFKNLSSHCGVVKVVKRVETLTYVAAAGALGVGGRPLGPGRRRALGSWWRPGHPAAAPALDAERGFSRSAVAAATAAATALQVNVRYAVGKITSSRVYFFLKII